MDQLYCTTKKSFIQLNRDSRVRIETLLKIGYKPAQIAREIHVHRSTITRELKRGSISILNSQLESKVVYEAHTAQLGSEKRNQNSHKQLKLLQHKSLIQSIVSTVKNQKWSFDIICGRMALLNSPVRLSTKTLYNYFHKGYLPLSAFDLPRMVSIRRKSSRPSPKRYSKGNSIDIRPPDVNQRDVFFHWEMDSIVGPKNQGPALLTITERKSRFELIYKLSDKSNTAVVGILNHLEDKLLSDFSKVFQSITTDNGPEFQNYIAIQQSHFNTNIPRTIQYFCRPYASYQRGTNENINRDVRTFFPKKTSFEHVSSKMIKRVQNKINHRPRKILGYKTPYEVLKEQCMLYNLSFI